MRRLLLICGACSTAEKKSGRIEVQKLMDVMSEGSSDARELRLHVKRVQY